MRLIGGSAGAGKTFILAEEALKSSETNNVLIFTSNPGEIFSKLGLIAGKSELTGITVVKIERASEIIPYLLKNTGIYNDVFIDMDDLKKETSSYAKLEGFDYGAQINMTATWQTNLNATTGEVTLYKIDEYGGLAKVKSYSRGYMRKQIENWIDNRLL